MPNFSRRERQRPRHSPLLFFVLLLVFFTYGPAHACIADVPPVTEEDLASPPAEMLALKGIITKITLRNGSISSKPHGGFLLEIRPTKIVQGEASETTEIVYGGCHNLPGRVGETINVLAIKEEQRWIAPGYWMRSNDPCGQGKCRPASCGPDGSVVFGWLKEGVFTPSPQGKAYYCVKTGVIPRGY